ncbi:MAG: HPr family phosphocarrier protein [Pseudomonadota bacterium]
MCNYKFRDRKEDRVQIKSFIITNKLGIHVRPATQLVTTANKFISDISIKKDELEIDAKGIMGILMLAASQGSEIVIRAEGKDAREAIDELGRLIEERFGEE